MSTERGRFVSIGVKLALGTVLLVALVSAALAFQLIDRERTSLVLAKRTAASMVADLFATGLAAPADFGDAEAIEAELARLAPNAEVSYAAVWLRGATKPTAELRGNGRPPGAAPTAGGVAVLSDRISVARPIVGRKGDVLGFAVVELSLVDENAAYAAARGRILFVTVLLALGTSAVLFFLVRQIIVMPLAALGRAASRLERGEGRSMVAVGANDEIGQLGEAFNAMGGAIRDREDRLALARRKLQDVLDNMGQAIVVFGPDGRIEGAPSRTSARLFGAERLQGRVDKLLYPDARPSNAEVRAFTEWLRFSFEVTDEAWDEVAKLAPTEVVLPGQTVLALEFRRIPADDGKTSRVMLLATDVTDRRRLEQAVAQGEQDHARQMGAMRRLIAGGGHVFVTFLEGAGERLTRVRSALEGEGDATEPAVATAFQDVHTVKSEARAFGLDALAAEAHAMEETLSSALVHVRGGTPPAMKSLRETIAPRLDAADRALASGRDLFVEASPIGQAALDQVTVARGDLEKLSTVLDETKAAPESLRRVVARLSSRPFGETAASLVDAVPSWAEQIGKNMRVVVVGKDRLVPPVLVPHLPSILNQLARNAVAHGLESREVREQAGKDVVGTLRLSCEDAGDGVILSIADDGAGLDVDAISARASALGIDATNATDAAFAPGVSTRTEARGDLSGRGMGLSAVRAAAARAGYEVTVTSRPGEGTTFIVGCVRSGEASS